jgi:DnaK suppressor protein
VLTSVPATKAAAAKPPAQKAPAKKASTPAVREDESPWTASELVEVRTELDLEIGRLHHQIAEAEEGIADLLRDSGDGAGDDQADAGTKTFEREHEMSLANNARVLLQQNERALARLDDGTYGICERCGKPVGKFRLQAFPRATLCVLCKQIEERR